MEKAWHATEVAVRICIPSAELFSSMLVDGFVPELRLSRLFCAKIDIFDVRVRL